MAEAADLETPVDDLPAADPAIEAKAREHGWTPKERFRGDAAKWVDAKTFLDKADTVMPLLRKQRDDLMGEVQSLRAQDAARAEEMKAIKAALKAVEEAQDEDLSERIEATKADLEEQIAAASEAGDHRRIGKLTGDLAELIAAEKVKAARPPASEPKPPVQELSPEYRAWQGENSDWLGKDTEKTDMALAFGQAIARTGLRGKPFYAELDKRLERYYGTGAPERKVDSKVDGGKPNGGGGGSEGEPKGFADLPKDARDTCIRLERKMVGEGKPHKDAKSWRASYARQYHEQEA